MDSQIKNITVEDQTNRVYVFLIAFVAALGGFLFGYDLVIMAGAELFLKEQFNLSGFWFGFSIASASLGCIAGPFLSGWLCDKIGRRNTLNVARAGIVDEKALINALKEKRIKGAALDCIEKYPVCPGDPWLELDDVIITPHLGSRDNRYPDSVFMASGDEIIEMSRMHLPRWIVNKAVKPRRKMSKRPDSQQ